MKYDEVRAKSLANMTESSLFLYEDNNFWVVYKPYDVQIDGSRPCTLEKLIKRFRRIDGNLKFCHQLDYATSGCILIAKNGVAAQQARVLFDRRLVKKRYEAIVWGHISKNVFIEEPLREERFRSVVHSQGKTAHTLVERIQVGIFNGRPASLVSLNPHTGRRHQLRAHLNHIGHRIVGDVAYGGDSSIDRMMLHSTELVLGSPIDIHVESESGFGSRINSEH